MVSPSISPSISPSLPPPKPFEYLRVDDQATYIDVFCDGFYVRFYKTVIGYFFARILEDGTDENIFEITDYHNDGSIKTLGYDSDRVVTIIERTPLRVKIRIRGIPANSGDTADLASCNYAQVIASVYPDRITIEYSIDMSGDQALTMFGFRILPDLGNLDNRTWWYEDKGNEVQETLNANHDDADYLFVTGDQMSVQAICVDNDLLGFSNTQVIRPSTFAGLWQPYVISPTIGAGLTTFKRQYIIDSGQRSEGSKAWAETDRLIQGNQYLDGIEDQNPVRGDDVVDMIFPARVDNGTLHADGAHHYEPDYGQLGRAKLRIAVDRRRYRASRVIHDWPFMIGSIASPVNLLLNHLRMDDNAASSIIVAETGPDANWETAALADRDTNNDSVIVGNFRGRALDTKDLYLADLICGAGTIHDNAFLKKGTIIAKITPQFPYDDIVSQTIFDITTGPGDDHMKLYYHKTIDRWYAQFKWNGTTTGIASLLIEENLSLQRETIFHVAWDSNRDFTMLAIDGQVIGIVPNLGTPTADEPSVFYFGQNVALTGPSDIILDEVKTFSEAILPYGGYHIGPGVGLNADIEQPHRDLTFLWDCQSVNAKGGTSLGRDVTGVLTGSGTFWIGASLVGPFGYDNLNDTSYITFPNGAGANRIVEPSHGTIAFWANVQTEANDRFCGFSNGASNYMRLSAQVSGSQLYPNLTYRANDNNFIIDAITELFDAQQWHWWKIEFSDSNNDGIMRLWMDGRLIGEVAVTQAFQGDVTTLVFSADGAGGSAIDARFARAFVSRQVGTPEVLTAFARPLHPPIIDQR